MANHALPTTTNAYADVLSYIDARLDDLSRWNGTAYAEPTGLITGAIRWNATTFKWDTWNGTNWTTPLTTRLDITAFNGSIGASTPSTGAFTTLSSSSTTTLAAGTTIGGVAAVTTTGTQTLTNKTISTGGIWNGGIITEAYGGTGSATFAGAPFALKGANTDLTSIANLTSFGNTSTTHVRVTTTGLVGINTVADVRLHVKDANSVIKSEGTSGYGSFYATASTGQFSYVFFGTAGVETARIAVSPTNTLTIATGSSATTRLWVGSTGLVGIGDFSLGDLLEVTKNQNSPTTVVIRNTDPGASASSVLQLTGGSKYVNMTLAPNSNYIAIQGVGGIVAKYEDFNTHDWRNNAGTTTAVLDAVGTLITRTAVITKSAVSTDGYVGLRIGTPTNSGYLEFFSPTGGVRQGYIGFGTTNASINQGTIPYVAGLHAFTGPINIATSGSAGGLRITDTGVVGANIHLSGNGGVTPDKYLRVTSGVFQILNNAYTTALLELNDTGTLSAAVFSGPVTALKSATTSVNVSAAAAPTSGQVLTATSDTTATWQTAGLGTYFQSADQTVTPNSSLAVAHGLGAKPRLYKLFLKCATAEANYSVGDETEVLSFISGVSIIMLAADTTNIRVNYTGGSTQVLNKTTQIATTITSTSWRFVVRAWL